MKQYHDFLQHILVNGVDKSDRTGTGTRSIFGYQMRFDLSKGFPLVTTKKVHFKSILHELIWFLRGDTNIKYLNDNGVTIWDEWRRPYNFDRNMVWVTPKEAEYAPYTGDFSYAGLNLPEGEDRKLADTWVRMMRRCYDENYHRFDLYGANGVSVHPSWHDPRAFIEGVKKIPHWWYKQKNWDEFELDKDYYGSRQYGPETSVWLRTDENNLYTKSAKPVSVVDGDGIKRLYLSQAEASRRIGMPTSTLSRFVKEGVPSTLKGNNKSFAGWEFTELDVPDYLPRLELIEDGDLGRVYGAQWRSWHGVDGSTYDQLKWVIEEIKRNPDSRRLVVSAWNPAEVDKMALPPCHMMFQFYVANGKLSCQLYQRSADAFLGVPFNIASYALLTEIIARLTGLQAGEFVHTIGDGHIYNNHMVQVKQQLNREPLRLPRIGFAKRPFTIDTITADDVVLVGYESHERISAPVAV